MGIRFYSTRDMALGQFLVENCFQLHQGSSHGGGERGASSNINTAVNTATSAAANAAAASATSSAGAMKERENTMLDQTLSYAHRPGRIDIMVFRIGESATATTVTPTSQQQPTGQSGSSSSGGTMDPSNAHSHHPNAASLHGWNRREGQGLGPGQYSPYSATIYMHSYCKECERVVTPEVAMSDETWKMSFGKFLEITFYNRSARGRTGGCTHFLRDCHVLNFTCEGYLARFDFTPIHPYALHVRSGMTFPVSYHNQQSINVLSELPSQFSILLDGFGKSISFVHHMALDVLGGKPEDLTMVLTDLNEIEEEIQSTQIALTEDVQRTIEQLQSDATTIIESKSIRDGGREGGRDGVTGGSGGVYPPLRAQIYQPTSQHQPSMQPFPTTDHTLASPLLEPPSLPQLEQQQLRRQAQSSRSLSPLFFTKDAYSHAELLVRYPVRYHHRVTPTLRSTEFTPTLHYF